MSRVVLRGGPNHGEEVEWPKVDPPPMVRVPERVDWFSDREPRVGRYLNAVRMPSGSYWMWWAGWENEPLVAPEKIYATALFVLERDYQQLATERCRDDVMRLAQEHGLEIDWATVREELDPDEDDELKNRDQGKIRVRAIAHKPFP